MRYEMARAIASLATSERLDDQGLYLCCLSIPASSKQSTLKTPVLGIVTVCTG